MFPRRVVVLAGALALAGCVWRTDMPRPASFGPPPRQFERAAELYLVRVLPQASALQYRFGEPYRAYRFKPLLDGGGVEWRGWALDVEVNMRDEDGALGTWKTMRLQFAGNAVIDSHLAGGAEPMWRKLDGPDDERENFASP